MFRAVQATLNKMTADINAGRFADWVAQCDFPFAMQVEGEMTVYQTPALALAAWQRCEATRRAAGIVQVQTRIVALELPRLSRFRVWTEVLHLDAAGIAQSASQVIHYFRDRGDWYCLEMQAVSARAVPAVVAAFKADAAIGQPALGTLA